MPWLRDRPGGVDLDLLVQPRASRTAVVGEHGGRLKVALAAPPVEGEANGALLRFLSGALAVRRSDVLLLRGEAGRRKTIRVSGRSAAEARAALLPDGS